MEDRRDLHALEHVLQLRSSYVPGRQHLFPAAASTLQASGNYHKQQQATRKAASGRLPTGRRMHLAWRADMTDTDEQKTNMRRESERQRVLGLHACDGALWLWRTRSRRDRVIHVTVILLVALASIGSVMVR